jgi:hypothetical protein
VYELLAEKFVNKVLLALIYKDCFLAMLIGLLIIPNIDEQSVIL